MILTDAVVAQPIFFLSQKVLSFVVVSDAVPSLCSGQSQLRKLLGKKAAADACRDPPGVYEFEYIYIYMYVYIYIYIYCERHLYDC